ncbi:FprA family A-type flavoprotein [uncultured Methanobrevibacter sp.]|uniref:FprA family A-type flavoprotein n=1 Tax=uncultured Methanobrevibacter sp. TaxID=253161 RepID=UPI0025F86DFC|nr:FprA family A-type flavoprotein [uncultured Methanobrevibacter sp.]
MKADAVKIADDVYWVGALDWDNRDFHGFAVPGMTYNAYLVFGDEKIALIDNVFEGFFPEFWARIQDAFKQEGLDEVKIDVLVQNHIENDHIGSIPELLEKCPNIEFYCSAVAASGLKKQIHALDNQEMNPVETGDTLDLGGKTLTFINAPMLHWPDSNFTLYNEGGILFSNDAFGQHVCESKRFDTDQSEAFMELHTRRFYANLVSLSSMLVVKKVEEMTEAGYLDNLKIIAPCHGQIWKNPQIAVDLYAKWATGKCDDKITVIYNTMHHSTQKLAHSLCEGIMSEGVDVKMHFLQMSPESDILADVLDSKAIALGVPTMMNNPYPKVGNLMYYFDATNMARIGDGKKAVTFSSKGWAGGAIKKLNESLAGAGFDVLEEDSIDIKFAPTDDELDQAYELGKKLAQIIKEE